MVDVPAAVKGVIYVLSTGCPVGGAGQGLPPHSLVNDYSGAGIGTARSGAFHHVRCREGAGREARRGVSPFGTTHRDGSDQRHGVDDDVIDA